ncbi:hypothetical protein N8W35_10025 [Enterobacter roggenkampii]|uniref:hypothetical protein n=1 Tax=Enterobacter roggenkampii TaxID=1812935 RepID=UPI0021C9BB7A|nr:hypothetical protein [Enterobacter roggenkampii]MCU3853442.1 hypothetical protein [Enterobacter roggenkampii]
MANRRTIERNAERYRQSQADDFACDRWLESHAPDATAEQRRTFKQRYNENRDGRSGESRFQHAMMLTLIP